MHDKESDYGSEYDCNELSNGEHNENEDDRILSRVLDEPVRKRVKLELSQKADLDAFKKHEIDIDTLRKRLAGPSVAKSGQEGVDQDKVNQIIYDASEGSKYFENEKKKNVELTLKIERTLEKAAKILANVQDLAIDERKIDTQVSVLEASIDLSQYIMHIDCDAFYASVEELDRPELKHVPMGVGIGVLTTANYAARKFGVRSAMPNYIAKKLCPELVCVPLNFEKYISKAGEIREILARADPNYQAASLDEAYLNITEYVHTMNLPVDQVVAELRDEIHKKTGLTVSAGVAANSRLAKIGSNMNKPNGQFMLPNDRRAILEFVSELPVRKVNGIGKVFERQLTAIGVKKCKDIYTKRALLSRLFGQKSFDFLLGVYLGIGSTDIKPAEDHERKSIGTESTFGRLSDPADLRAKLRHIADELEKDCLSRNWAGRTLHLKIKKHTYEVYTRQRSIPRAIYLSKDLYEYALPLLEKELPLTLRLMGLRLMQLSHINKKPTSNFFRDYGFDTEASPARSGVGARNALFTAEDEEILEGDEDVANSEWIPGDDSVFKQQKRYEKMASTDNATKTVDDKDISNLPQCPICSRRISGDERVVSHHIDSCLNNQAIREVLKSEQSPAEQRTKPSSTKAAVKSSSLRSWLEK